ncbi:hypothetical protein HYV57_01310 [Candidatus Peregrinibacteria bacterium]|nr:hypothetical protein [Candidatus Peregrinibacteria bacterium]
MRNEINITRIGGHRFPYEYYSQHNGISGVRTDVAYGIGCDRCGKCLHIDESITNYSEGDFEAKIWETRTDFSRVFCVSNNEWKCQADGET